eukprot:341249-Alexandrium_andersonii.AAC.1
MSRATCSAARATSASGTTVAARASPGLPAVLRRAQGPLRGRPERTTVQLRGLTFLLGLRGCTYLVLGYSAGRFT